MQTKFAAKRVGTLNKFFTKVSVGEILAREIVGVTPKSILDLGAGEGSLSVSAISRWPNAQLVTVDLDPSTSAALELKLSQVGCSSHRHYLHDALDPNLANFIGQYHEPFDVAVCNPPFFNPEWSDGHTTILHRGHLSDAARSTHEVTAEILFIAQSLSLLRDGGRLAVIVPDSLVTTGRAERFRTALLHNHKVEKVIQLPINSFMETDARCYIFVIKNGSGPTRDVSLYSVSHDQSISDPFVVSVAAAKLRMDYNFHSLRCQISESHVTLRSLGAEVFRGSISTVQKKAASFPVFHTSDYKSIVDGMIKLPESEVLCDFARVIAEPGDILLARVDRNLHEKIGLVVCGSAAITDCVYRIRLPHTNRQAAYQALCSDDGRRNLRALTKGVGARIIGKADLLDMPLTLTDSSPCWQSTAARTPTLPFSV
jgi:type I restriction enzyme M protein